VEREEEGFTQIDSLDLFNQAVAELSQHAVDRYNAVVDYLDTQP